MQYTLYVSFKGTSEDSWMQQKCGFNFILILIQVSNFKLGGQSRGRSKMLSQ